MEFKRKRNFSLNKLGQIILAKTKQNEKVKVMPATKHQHKFSSAAAAHLNELLDEALKETFPASDPVAIDIEIEIEIESPKHDDDNHSSGPAQRRIQSSPDENVKDSVSS